MTCEEFSNAFDVLLSSYKINPEFGDTSSLVDVVFDEYEKSIFLTKAQEEILKELYSGYRVADSYEQTEEIRRYLNTLNRVSKIENSEYSKYLKVFDRLTFEIPEDVWFITYEVLESSDITKLVVPVTRDALFKTLQNPFRNTDDKCLRIDNDDSRVSIIGNNIKNCNYELHYLTKPTPIILIDLENDLSIEGIIIKTECTLHEGLHYKILDRAVALAIASKLIQK